MTDPYTPERPIICPYDRNHSIAPSRLQKHLIKCSAHFPDDYKITCSFNATHRLSKDEIKDHIFDCPDHKYVQPTIYQMTRTHGSVKSCLDIDCTNSIACEESWDEEDDNVVSKSGSSVYPRAELLTRVRPISHESRSSNFVRPSMPVRLKTCNRPPTGLAETLMMEDSENSTIEDVESVTSSMGMGRGKPWNDPYNVKRQEVIGRGRGSGQPKY